MNDSLLFNLLILLFFILTIVENFYRPKLPKSNKVDIPISSTLFFTLLIVGTIIVLFFLISAEKIIINWYIKLLLSALVLAHALWLSLNKKLFLKILFVLFALTIVVLRFSYPHWFIHNLYIFTSILWLGPFFPQTRIITIKTFFAISLFWLIYDIIFVWFSPFSQQVVATTKAIDFPLSLVVGKNSIGLADLFWSGMLLSFLKKNTSRFLAIFLLLGSDVLLEIIASNLFKIKIFPLLVIWVPLGLLILFYEKYVD